MDYHGDVERSIAYIESNIGEELTAEGIAGRAGYSVYHFCRLFSRYKGLPLKEYIRKRRLALARQALLNDRRIIDVAMDCGYETASGFSKAFRRAFGYSPTTYMTRMSACAAGKDDLDNRGGCKMEPVFVRKPAFRVAGYGIGISTDLGSGCTRDVGAWWSHYEGENLENKMYRQLDPPKHGEVGVCIPSSGGESVSYLLGVIVEDFSRVTPDMMTAEIPAAEYAVFTTPPVDTTGAGAAEDALFCRAIRETWRYVFEEWFPDSGYVYDEGKSDFEFYDERCHFRPDTVAELYVPVKSK